MAIETTLLLAKITGSAIYQEFVSDSKSYSKATIKEALEKNAEKKRVINEIKKYISFGERMHESASLDEEYDLEGLTEYYLDAFLTEIEGYFGAPGEQRKTIREQIFENARTAARCEKSAAISIVDNHTSALISCLSYRKWKQLSSTSRFFVGRTHEGLNDIKEMISALQEQFALFSTQLSDPNFTELVNDLNDMLIRTRESHPSFKLMRIGANNNGSDSQFQQEYRIPRQGKTDRRGRLYPFWQLIVETWGYAENHSVVIEGEGGIGKTIALLSMLEDIPEDIKVPAIYINATNLIQRSGDCLTIPEYLERTIPHRKTAICFLASQYWHGPSLVLLLDGLDEVPVSNREDIFTMLREWQLLYPGVQTIVASRPINGLNLKDVLPGNPIPLILSPLNKKDVRSHIKKFAPTLPVPPINHALWGLLVYPIFLTLYITTSRFGKADNYKYELDIKDEVYASAIIWNYLQWSLLRKQSDQWVIRSAITHELLLPQIAWRMVMCQKTWLNRDEISEIIESSIHSFDATRLPHHLHNLFSHYELLYDELPNVKDLPLQVWKRHVFHESGLLVVCEESVLAGRITVNRQTRYEFLHKIFQDCLASVHLVNTAEMLNNSINCSSFPAEWCSIPNDSTLDYAAELISQQTINRLWESNRQAQQYRKATYVPNRTVTYTLLELQKRHDPAFMGFNFSGMDLTDVSLARYIDLPSTRTGFFCKGELSNDTVLSRKTFQSVGHNSWITCIGVMPDGRIVSGSGDSTVQVWNPSTGECLRTLNGHTSSLTCLAILQDETIVSGAYDCTVRSWNLKTGERHAVTLPGYIRGRKSIVALKNSNGVAIAYEKSVAVWDFKTSPTPTVLGTHDLLVNCICVLENGHVVSVSDDATIKVWDISQKKCLHLLKGCHKGPITFVASLPGNRFVSGSEDKTLCVYGPTTNQMIPLVGHDGMISAIAVLPDGRIASGSSDKTIRIWDAKTGECQFVLKRHTGKITCLCVLDNGQLVSGASDHTLRLWNTITGKHLRLYSGHSRVIECLAPMPDGRFVSGSYDHTISVWKPENSWAQLRIAKQSGAITSVAVLSRTSVLTGSSNGAIHIWDYTKCMNLGLLGRHSRSVESISVLPGGKCVSGSYDSRLCVWDPDLLKRIQISNGHNKEITGTALLPSGEIVFSTMSSRLNIWNPDTKECRVAPISHARSITCVRALHDGKIVSGSSDKSLRIWDSSLSRCERILNGHSKAVYCVAELKNGWIASGSLDHTILIWDIETGHSCCCLHDHRAAVNCITELENGCLVSGSDDRTIRVWGPVQGSSTSPAPLKVISCSSPVYCMANLPDGRIIVGSGDGIARIWNMETYQCEAELEATEVNVAGMVFSATAVLLEKSLYELLRKNGATVEDENSDADLEKKDELL